MKSNCINFNPKDNKIVNFGKHALMGLLVLVLLFITYLVYHGLADRYNVYKAFSSYCDHYTTYYKNRYQDDEELKKWALNLENFNKAEAEVKAFKPQMENVKVIRMATASDVMLEPATYRRDYSGTDITYTEKGKGAEVDDIAVFYLSDGHVIKANTENNALWLGAHVGTTVKKVRYKRVSYKKPLGLLGGQNASYVAEEVVDYVPLL